jgi:hypothetical protein
MKKNLGMGFYFNAVIALTLSAAAIFTVYETRKQGRVKALSEAESEAKLILDRNLAIHTYFSHQLKPSVFKETEPVRSDTFFDPTWMSSTYAVREIDKNFKQLNEGAYYYKECAINARSPENEADEFEKDFIRKINSDPELKYLSKVRKIDGRYFFVTLRRGEVMEESCLKCHSTPDKAPSDMVTKYGATRSFNRSVDEVISAISIRVPLSEAYANTSNLEKHLSFVFITVLAIIFAVHFIIYKVFVSIPITNLQNRTLDISRNDGLLGKELPLPSARELKSLTSAFNTMSKKLRYQMDHLEEMVAGRTVELTLSNEKLKNALDEIKTIRGIIPICMYCKGIRDDKGAWNQLENYIAEHSDAEFSHSICEKCMEKYYPDDTEKKE